MSLRRWDSADFQCPVLISATPHNWKVTGEILCPTALIVLRFFKFGKVGRINSDTSALCWPYLTQYRTFVFLGEANSPWETLIQVLWVLLKIPDIKTGWLPSSN